MENKLKQWIEAAYSNAAKKGFHDRVTTDRLLLCLVLTELMECVEAHRCGNHATIKDDPDQMADFHEWFEDEVKDTVEDELADTVIRLCDLAGLRGIDIDPILYKPCGEVPEAEFPEQLFWIAQVICNEILPTSTIVNCAIARIEVVAYLNGIDLHRHIDLKMRYNLSRPPMHGGKRY